MTETARSNLLPRLRLPGEGKQPGLHDAPREGCLF